MIGHMGGSAVLRDSYGRVADDLRISITDRCNFRCIYCMPAEGLKWLNREDLLRFEEITRLARIFVERYGVRTIRITGGEPLVRVKVDEEHGQFFGQPIVARDAVGDAVKKAVSYTHLTLPTICSV